MKRLTVVQMLPALESGGVEKGTLEIGRALVAAGHRSIVISAGGRLTPQLAREGSEHVAWPVGAKSLGCLRHVRPLRAFLAREHADILHLRSRLPAWIGWLAWRKLPAAARPHLVTTVHGPYTPGHYSSVMTRGERVIAISKMIVDYLHTHYPAVPDARIRLIPRGVDPSACPYGYRPDEAWRSRFYAQFPAAEGKFLITLPARLTRWKGQEHFIEVIAALRLRGIPAHGLLVGEAHPKKRDYECALRDHAAAKELTDHLSFTGHRSDVREIMAVSDVVVSLSLDPEAFGRVTLEALALGRPVAAYAHGGVAEQLAAIFPNGAIAVGDLPAMVERLADWYSARPIVPPNNPFTLERMQSATLAVYDELIHV